MGPLLRRQFLSRLFGEDAGGLVATALVAAGIERVISGARRSADRIDRVELKPGERYVVSTRPPYTRRERKLLADRSKLQARVDAATAPGRRTRRLARKVESAQHRAERRPGRGDRRARRAAELTAEYERRTAPTPKTVALQQRLAGLDRQLSAERAKVKDGRGRRPSTSRIVTG